MSKYVINGAEVDAKFFTREQKDDHRLVERVKKAYAEKMAAADKWNRFVESVIAPLFIERVSKDRAEGEDVGGRGLTINNISKDARVIVKQNAYIRMNEYARQAKIIIDELLNDVNEATTAEVADLFQLLKSMFLEKKKMVYTPGIAAFVAMPNIRTKRLREAQELLRKSMSAEIGRIYAYVEERTASGEWKVVGQG